MEKAHLSSKPKVFYGYWIVAVSFLCVFVVAGCGFYVFSLFVKPLQEDFGWGRGEIMMAFTILYLIIAATAPFVGRVVDRYGARKVISMGAFITGLGFALLSLVGNILHFYVGYAVLGVGEAAMGIVPSTAVVSNWFKKRRGMAIGIMSVGIGVGGFAMAPLIGDYLIPNFGWEASYLTLALLTWVLVIPSALLVIKTKPADIGLHPDGIDPSDAVTVTKAPLSASDDLNLRMALATSAFWLIGVSFLLICFSQVGVIQSQVPYLEDVGFPTATAAGAIGGVSFMSGVGKFFFGWLCDRMPAKYACLIGIGLQAAGVAVLINVGTASSLAIIWLYAITMGLGIGSWLPTMSVLTSTSFGLASYGAIFGMLALAQNVGIATGPLMAGYMYDSTNTYHWAFIIFLALYAVAMVSVSGVRRPRLPE